MLTTFFTPDQIAVFNSLPESTTEDEALARRVSLFLATRQVGDLRRLAVTARQGRVRISGNLNSFYHRQLALTYVRKVAGVLSVDDQISVTLYTRKPRRHVSASGEPLGQSA
jgi:osmotically-inducible protein OsmY